MARTYLLDTSCLIGAAPALEADALWCVSTVSVAELAFGLHHADPVERAARETRYRNLLAATSPIPYSAQAAHWFGAIAATVRDAGRSPRPRTADLMIASVAAELRVTLLTRNPADFEGLERILRIEVA